MKKNITPNEKPQEDDKNEELKEEKQHIKKDANFLKAISKITKSQFKQ